MGIEIVSSEKLAEELAAGDNSLIIVDARREQEFAAGHIPGAAWIGWEDWCEPAPLHAGARLAQPGYWGVIRRAASEELGRLLASAGLRDAGTIVVYADGPSTRGREGRVAWMLLYFGASRVCLLDGGWRGWLASGGDVQTETEDRSPGHFRVEFQEGRRRSLDELRVAYQSGKPATAVDTRSRPEFEGEIQKYLPRRGHLPGACLVPFAALFDEGGRYVSARQFADLLPERVRTATDVVSYCEVGVRACLFALLHEAYTGRVVSVYDGSIMQWSLDPGLPLDAP